MHSIYFFIYLCIEHLLVMDSIVKIVLALKLKFLLIILSIGTSYYLEQRAKRNADPDNTIEIIRTANGLGGSGNVNTRTFFRVAEEKKGSQPGSIDHCIVQPANNDADRPFDHQGLEIFIVF